MTRTDFAQAKRIVQRQRMRDAGLIELRRHHPDIVGQFAGDFLDDLQAGGMDAVVVGAENSHPLKCPFQSIPWRSMRRLYPSVAVGANPANPVEMPARRHNCSTVIGRTAT